MTIGVKYCGGCNSRYDRNLFLEKIKTMSSFEFCNAQVNIKYDIVLVLCGCSSCCANYKQLEYKHELILVKDEQDYEEVINVLNKYKTRG